MKKQTVIVTGASSGIGLGIAGYFLDRGCNVLMSSFSLDKLEAAYLQLGGGENLAWLAGDVGDKATGIALAAKAIEQFGSIYVLVNDAQVFKYKPERNFLYHAGCNTPDAETKGRCDHKYRHLAGYQVFRRC
jgi:NAD(P)-dependent dehydrogenase (short-subunit alcohol dehydrogenase family)